MKRTIYSIILSSALAAMLISCNDWLTVPVDGRSTSPELFETGDGYRSALNGLYKGMVDNALYGENLQYGVIDFFSNQYRLNLSQQELGSTALIAAGKRDFKEKTLQPIINAIWLKAYNNIAAANNLIQHISSESPSKFKRGQEEKDVILGEAKAIRAFLHFDMLRLFAPAPIGDDGKVYIPYVSDFPNVLAEHISVKDALQKVIADLEEARDLLKPFDTSDTGMSANASGKTRFYNQLESGMEGYAKPEEIDEFFYGRGYRLSYWAVMGLLARVYQYNGGFDASFYAKAKDCAEEVFKAKCTGMQGASYTPFQNERFDFAWTEQPEQMMDVRMIDNLLFGLYRDNDGEKLIGAMESQFPRAIKSPGNYNLCVVNVNGQDIFKTTDGIDEAENDIRSKRLLYIPTDGYQILMSVKWYVKEKNTAERDKTLNIFPLLRTSELRYIIAETEARKGNFTEAYKILNDMRDRRGLQGHKLPVQTTFDAFVKDLVREGQREWISEGQLFYLYKRLNAGVKRDDGTTVPFSKEECVLPIPTEENR